MPIHNKCLMEQKQLCFYQKSIFSNNESQSINDKYIMSLSVKYSRIPSTMYRSLLRIHKTACGKFQNIIPEFKEGHFLENIIEYRGLKNQSSGSDPDLLFLSGILSHDHSIKPLRKPGCSCFLLRFKLLKWLQ